MTDEPVWVTLKFILEVVGQEWDGRYVPVNDLSYPPEAPIDGD